MSNTSNGIDLRIGYVEYRTNLPGGRHANTATMQAYLVHGDGTGRRALAPELGEYPDTGVQFSNWSPDARTVILIRGWESAENAAWEEEHRTFRFNDQYLVDTYLLDLETNETLNLSAVERVSHFNPGGFFWPGDPNSLGCQAMIGDVMPLFRVDRDGRNRRNLTEESKAFAYGFNPSPDGSRIAYHEAYQVYIANADGSAAQKIDNGDPFHFLPQWSPDGEWLLFLSGKHMDCDPYVVRPDGADLHKIGDRGGYWGSVLFLDVDDFHQGSSDVPCWSADGKHVYYAAEFDGRVELARSDMDGHRERLTNSEREALNYHPKTSDDGRWVVFGSNRSGTRQLYVMPAEGGDAWAITDVAPGWGAMWPVLAPSQTSR